MFVFVALISSLDKQMCVLLSMIDVHLTAWLFGFQ